MNISKQNFDAYAFSKQPGYDEPAFRKEFAKAMPLRTVVIYCYDPRVVDIPVAVAKEFGEVYPGEDITDAQGNKVATTKSLLEVVVAGGRAIDALRSGYRGTTRIRHRERRHRPSHLLRCDLVHY